MPTARPPTPTAHPPTPAAHPTPAARPPSRRSTVRRLRERARYGAEDVRAILDEGFICHLGVLTEQGPLVLPMAYARLGRDLYLHGAPANAILRAACRDGVCVTVTLVDGLVLARAALHHSVNYRSVVVFGRACEVTDMEEKRRAAVAVVDHVVRGRSADARPPTAGELRATRIVRVPLAEASAKVRTGGPRDEESDLAWPAWAGELPLRTVPGEPLPAAGLSGEIAVPGYVSGFSRR